MRKLANILVDFLEGEESANTVEYCILVALLGAACLVALLAVGMVVRGRFAPLGSSTDTTTPEIPLVPLWPLLVAGAIAMLSALLLRMPRRK
jgi:Flp pilus assembly pilin Flp